MSKPLCLIQAPFFTRSGYGDWANAVGKSILRYDKFDVKIVPTRWGNCQTKRYIENLLNFIKIKQIKFYALAYKAKMNA